MNSIEDHFFYFITIFLKCGFDKFFHTFCTQIFHGFRFVFWFCSGFCFWSVTFFGLSVFSTTFCTFDDWVIFFCFWNIFRLFSIFGIFFIFWCRWWEYFFFFLWFYFDFTAINFFNSCIFGSWFRFFCFCFYYRIIKGFFFAFGLFFV